MSNVVDPPQIYDRCDVQWRGGQQVLKAVVVERRPLSHRKRKRDEDSFVAPNLESLKAHEIEYYVHYVDRDRRLDEWITLDKFQIDTLERHVSNELPVELQERMVRRRSSASLAATNDSEADGETVEADLLSGGNWHGHSGDPSFAQLERDHEERTKVKNIERIIMGDWVVEAWYYSPYPDEYSDLETLYVCEFCLSYMKKSRTYVRHKASCSCRKPPGKEIYREGDLSVFELDGKDHKSYCQKLCLLAKLFLDHKTLYYDVNPFYFYIVTKVDSNGAHLVGYFSKEKVSNEGYNLACILTLPQYQQSGYGKFIISLSYELTKREGKTGSPEKPLSDLGKLSYRSYWTHVLMHLLAEHDTEQNLTINDMSQRTGIKTEDIISTLQSLDMVKVWKGQHVIYVKQDIIRDYMKQDKHFRLCKNEFLEWEPHGKRSESTKEK